MKNFLLTSSIGKKFVVSLSGLFDGIYYGSFNRKFNAVIDDTGDMYNIAANFMGTNPIIKLLSRCWQLVFNTHCIHNYPYNSGIC